MPVTCRKIGKKFRIVGRNGRIEKTGKGNAADGGGHSSRTSCTLQARAINSNTQNLKHPIKRTKIVPSNPLKADPTRSKTLRDKFTREITKRFQELKGKILKLIVRDDAFGLKTTRNEGNESDNKRFNNARRENDRRIDNVLSESERCVDGQISRTDREDDSKRKLGAYEVVFNSRGKSNNDSSTTGNERRNDGRIDDIRNTRFAFRSDTKKIEAFRKWLSTQTNSIVPVAGGKSRQWWTQFVEEGYRKGAGRAFEDTRVAQRALATTSEELSFFEGTKEEFLRQSFGQPVAIEKVKLLSSRVFTELKGINDDMAQRLTRELTEGLARGENPLTIAREINKLIDIPIKRARVIARTEIIRAHAEGQLDAMEAMGLEDVGVMVEWSTAGDDRVCPLCSPLDGVVMKIKEARGLIPRHPNCRCAHIPANVGEPTKGQKRSQSAIESSFDKSIRAEIPKGRKRSLATQKQLSKWQGADRKIAKERPESILTKPIPKPKEIIPKPEIKKLVSPKPSIPKPKVTKPVLPKKPVKKPVAKKVKPPSKEDFQNIVQSKVTGKDQTLVQILGKTGGKFTDVNSALIKLIREGKVIRTGSKFRLKVVERFKSQAAWEKGLTDLERNAIKKYTGDSYTLVRKCQNLKVDCTELLKNQIKNIEAAMAKAPKFRGKTYRGLNFKNENEKVKFIADLKKSKNITDKGFVSSSKDIDVALDFAEREGPGVILEIEGKSGVDIHNLSNVKDEQEILFGKGIKFKFKEIKTGPDRSTILVLEEI